MTEASSCLSRSLAVKKLLGCSTRWNVATEVIAERIAKAVSIIQRIVRLPIGQHAKRRLTSVYVISQLYGLEMVEVPEAGKELQQLIRSMVIGHSRPSANWELAILSVWPATSVCIAAKQWSLLSTAVWYLANEESSQVPILNLWNRGFSGRPQGLWTMFVTWLGKLRGRMLEGGVVVFPDSPAIRLSLNSPLRLEDDDLCPDQDQASDYVSFPQCGLVADSSQKQSSSVS